MDVLSVGGLTIDHLFKVSRLPRIHFEGEIRDFGTYFGGRAANVAAIVARLGLESGIIAPVGNDFVTSGYKEHLEKFGVDLSCLRYYPEKSAHVYIFTNSNGNQITFFYKGVCSRFGDLEVPTEVLNRAKTVHITTTNEPTFSLKIAEVAVNQRVPLRSFDPGNDPFIEVPDYLLGVVSRVNLLFLNTEEQRDILTRLGVRSIQELHEVGPETIVVIDKEERSSLISSMGNETTIPPLITRVVDPTGASDAYIAGFLAGLTRGFGLKQSGMLGAASASFAMESIGCQTNPPSWNKLLNRCLKEFGKVFSNDAKDMRC